MFAAVFAAIGSVLAASLAPLVVFSLAFLAALAVFSFFIVCADAGRRELPVHAAHVEFTPVVVPVPVAVFLHDDGLGRLVLAQARLEGGPHGRVEVPVVGQLPLNGGAVARWPVPEHDRLERDLEQALDRAEHVGEVEAGEVLVPEPVARHEVHREGKAVRRQEADGDVVAVAPAQVVEFDLATRERHRLIEGGRGRGKVGIRGFP